jgi:hypothetical protein
MRGRTLETDVAVTTSHAPAANTAAVVTLAAGDSDEWHVIDGVLFSYDTAPTGGSVVITDGVQTMTLLVDSAGPKQVGMGGGPIFCGGYGLAVTVTLAAGGASVTGSLNTLSR